MIRKIALYGKSGSGKDYVTEQLCSEKGISNSRRFAFADNVKRQIQIILNIPESDFHRYLHDEDYKNHSLVDVSLMKIVTVADTVHKDDRWKQTVSAKEFDDMSLIYDSIERNRIYMSLREFTVWYGTYLVQKYCGRKTWCHSLFNSELYLQSSSKETETLVVVTDCRFPHEYEECRKNGFKFVKITNSENKNEQISNIAESYYDEFEPDFVFYNSYDKKSFDIEFNRFLKWIEDN